MKHYFRFITASLINYQDSNRGDPGMCHAERLIGEKLGNGIFLYTTPTVRQGDGRTQGPTPFYGTVIFLEMKSGHLVAMYIRMYQEVLHMPKPRYITLIISSDLEPVHVLGDGHGYKVYLINDTLNLRDDCKSLLTRY